MVYLHPHSPLKPSNMLQVQMVFDLNSWPKPNKTCQLFFNYVVHLNKFKKKKQERAASRQPPLYRAPWRCSPSGKRPDTPSSRAGHCFSPLQKKGLTQARRAWLYWCRPRLGEARSHSVAMSPQRGRVTVLAALSPPWGREAVRKRRSSPTPPPPPHTSGRLGAAPSPCREAP